MFTYISLFLEISEVFSIEFEYIVLTFILLYLKHDNTGMYPHPNNTVGLHTSLRHQLLNPVLLRVRHAQLYKATKHVYGSGSENRHEVTMKKISLSDSASSAPRRDSTHCTIPFCYVAIPPVSLLRMLQQKWHNSNNKYVRLGLEQSTFKSKGLDRAL
jgi:hypothetical protein